LLLLFFWPFLRLADKLSIEVSIGGPCKKLMTAWTTVITKWGYSSGNFYREGTFDIEITPSKFTALFLAVNKSSLHPLTSSWI
jgi:hypothetical protein